MTAVQDHEVATTVNTDDVCHIVCHCTEDKIAACGLDCTGLPWDDDRDLPCPLCYEAWPDDAETCPWGCSCPEECGP